MTERKIAHKSGYYLSHKRWHRAKATRPQEPHPDPTVWFHGTARQFNAFAPRQPGDGVTTHWNNFLGGPHFAHDAETARMFAEGHYDRTYDQIKHGEGIPDGGRIIPARLQISRPRHFEKEEHLDAYALAYALHTGLVQPAAVAEHIEGHRTTHPSLYLGSVPWHLKNGSAQNWKDWLSRDPETMAQDEMLHTFASSFLADEGGAREERDKAEGQPHGKDRFNQEIGEQAREALLMAGHDGVTYGNTVEGGVSATPLKLEQVHEAYGHGDHSRAFSSATFDAAHGYYLDHARWHKDIPDLPSDRPIVSKLIPQLLDGNARWSVSVHPHPHYRGSHQLRIMPRALPPTVRTVTGRYGDPVMYDTRYAEAVPDPSEAHPDAVKLQHTVSTDYIRDRVPGHIYRGMSTEEAASIKAQGAVQSQGNYNLGDIQKGYTYFADALDGAMSYASGFAPAHLQPTFDHPGYAVEMRLPEDHPTDPNAPQGEIGVGGALPAHHITRAWKGEVVSLQPGSSDLYAENWFAPTGEAVYKDSGRRTPSGHVTWREMHPDEIHATFGHRPGTDAPHASAFTLTTGGSRAFAADGLVLLPSKTNPNIRRWQRPDSGLGAGSQEGQEAPSAAVGKTPVPKTMPKGQGGPGNTSKTASKFGGLSAEHLMKNCPKEHAAAMGQAVQDANDFLGHIAAESPHKDVLEAVSKVPVELGGKGQTHYHCVEKVVRLDPELLTNQKLLEQMNVGDLTPGTALIHEMTHAWDFKRAELHDGATGSYWTEKIFPEMKAKMGTEGWGPFKQPVVPEWMLMERGPLGRWGYMRFNTSEFPSVLTEMAVAKPDHYHAVTELYHEHFGIDLNAHMTEFWGRDIKPPLSPEHRASADHLKETARNWKTRVSGAQLKQGPGWVWQWGDWSDTYDMWKRRGYAAPQAGRDVTTGTSWMTPDELRIKHPDLFAPCDDQLRKLEAEFLKDLGWQEGARSYAHEGLTLAPSKADPHVRRWQLLFSGATPLGQTSAAVPKYAAPKDLRKAVDQAWAAATKYSGGKYSRQKTRAAVLHAFSPSAELPGGQTLDDRVFNLNFLFSQRGTPVIDPVVRASMADAADGAQLKHETASTQSLKRLTGVMADAAEQTLGMGLVALQGRPDLGAGLLRTGFALNPESEAFCPGLYEMGSQTVEIGPSAFSLNQTFGEKTLERAHLAEVIMMHELTHAVAFWKTAQDYPESVTHDGELQGDLMLGHSGRQFYDDLDHLLGKVPHDFDTPLWSEDPKVNPYFSRFSYMLHSEDLGLREDLGLQEAPPVLTEYALYHPESLHAVDHVYGTNFVGAVNRFWGADVVKVPHAGRLQECVSWLQANHPRAYAAPVVRGMARLPRVGPDRFFSPAEHARIAQLMASVQY